MPIENIDVSIALGTIVRCYSIGNHLLNSSTALNVVALSLNWISNFALGARSSVGASNTVVE